MMDWFSDSSKPRIAWECQENPPLAYIIAISKWAMDGHRSGYATERDAQGQGGGVTIPRHLGCEGIEGCNHME